jgi:autotransporter translocation and assembly factor TamB
MRRRWPKILLRASIGLIAATLLLVCLPFILLTIPFVRSYAVQRGLEYANQQSSYQIRIQSVDRLDPWGLVATGIRVQSEGELALDVGLVRVSIAPFSLLRGRLHVREVEVAEVHATLLSSKPSEPEPKEEASEQNGTFPIRVDMVRVRSAQIVLQGMGPVTAARVRLLEAAGEWSDVPWVFLMKADLEADANGQRVLSLSTKQNRWQLERGGSVHIAGDLSGAPLTLRANLAGADADHRFPAGQASLELTQLGPEIWSAFGLSQAEVRSPLTLRIDATSTGNDLSATLHARAADTAIDLEASLKDERATARLNAVSPNLRAASGLLPELAVKVNLQAAYDYSSAEPTVDARWQAVEIDQQSVPNGDLHAIVGDPVIRLERLNLDALGDALKIEARWNLEREAGDAQVLFDELVLAKIPVEQPARGVLDGEVRVAYGPNERLNGNAELNLSSLKVGGASVQNVDLRAKVKGSAARPEFVGTVGVQHVDVSGRHLDTLNLEASADSARVHATLDARGEGAWLEAELDGEGVGAPQQRLRGTGRGDLRGIPLTFATEVNRSPLETALELDFFSGKQCVRTHAVLDARDRVQALVEIDLIELEPWLTWLGTPGMGGQVRGRIVADGALDMPEVSADLSLAKFSAPGAPALEAMLHARASPAKGEAEIKANAWSTTEKASLELSGKVRAEKKRGEYDFAGAQYESHLFVRSPVAPLTKFASAKLEALQGNVELSVDGSGTLDHPAADVRLDALLSLPVNEDLPPERLSLEARIDRAAAAMKAKVVDQEGELLRAEVNVKLPEGDLGQAFAAMSQDGLPESNVHVLLSPRRLDKMQGVVAYLSGIYAVDVPVRVGAEMSASAKGHDLDGKARASLLVFGDALDTRCALGARSAVDIAFDLAKNDIQGRLFVKTDGGGSVNAKLSTRLLLGKEADPSSMLSAVRLEAQGRDIALSELPGLCDLEGGTAAFNLNAQALGDQPMSAKLELALDKLRSAHGGPVSMNLVSMLTKDAVHLDGQLRANGQPAGKVQGKLPIQYEADATMPSIAAQKPLSFDVRLSKLPLGPFMSFGEGLGRPKGTASGSLSLTGTMDKPIPAASIQLEEVAFSIASIAQPFRDINGRIELRDRRLRIVNLTARDGDGKLRVDGEAAVAENMSGSGELRLKAEDFPLRRQGEVIGKLSTGFVMRAKIDGQQRLWTDVSIAGGRLWLTGEKGKKVQSLDEHPDVSFIDAPEEDEEALEEGPEETTVNVTLAQLKVRSRQSLWVMHKDFTVQVGIDVQLVNEESMSLKGEAAIERGNLQLLGKSFRIEKGAIRFTGDFPPDPELELHAMYETPTGEDLKVDVTGRSSAPVLSFSGAATNAGEALAVLSGSGRAGAESQAQTDAQNFAAGLTAGLLSVAIREEFGEWVPIISIENDASGAPARARAGFDASKLIPPFLEGIARGAYVEGIVGSSNQTGGSVGLGVRLEVALPYDFVTSAGYGPGPTWSSDVTWSP